jgi:hypothetical protein
MKLRASLAAVLALVLVVVVAPEATGGGGTPITSCGQVVTTNAYLTGDLYCPASHGVIVGASGITIDLKGSVLESNRGIYRGIYDDSFDRVTIQNGVVRNFNDGVWLQDADAVSVVNMVSVGNVVFGITIGGDSALVKSSSVSANTAGIYINGAAAKVQSSSATGNQQWGIEVDGASAKIQSSTASGNSQHGIHVFGNAAVVKGNRAEGNGFPAGASDYNGTGILVDNYTTPPTGKNIARGNDNPNECDPTYLC